MAISNPEDLLWWFRARVIRWVDGDTVDLSMDQGLRVYRQDRFRLYGIDTPERGQPNHDEATAFMSLHAPADSDVLVRVWRNREDKYGRWLLEIFPDDLDTSLNDAIVAAGLARPYFGGTKGV